MSGRGLNILKDTFKGFFQDDALMLAAALAYYTIFSLGPLLFLLIQLAGVIFGEEAVRAQVIRLLQSYVGPEGASSVSSLVESAKTNGSGWSATLIGLASLLFGATGVLGQLQKALNNIWGVKPKAGAKIKSFLRKRALSVAMIFGMGSLLLVFMVASTVVSALSQTAAQFLPWPGWITLILSETLTFLVVSLFFGLIYRFLPDVQIAWRNVWVGAMTTGALFTLGKFLLSLYLGRAGASAYGAAGSVLIILLWVYYSAAILFLGAEFTQAYAKHRGVPLKPDEHAEPI